MNTAIDVEERFKASMAKAQERIARIQAARADANPLISTSVEVAPISLAPPATITQAPAATFTPKTPYPAPTFEPTPAAINVVADPLVAAPAQGESVDIPSAKKHSTKEASYVALGQLGLKGIKTSADDVYLVIASAIRAGAVDVTRREVQVLFERRFERRMDANLISARVNELVTAGKVLERKEDRICTVTGNKVGALYVVMKQTRMVW